MRLYAFLLLAGAALCARAASIPVAETEKKVIDIVPDKLDKLPENTSSEQELIDQENTIKDVDNKLRTKPEDIPVEVIVENVQPALIAGNEEEEINRPVPDLRNPGPPQRQEHETQNPEYYASEQQTIALFKQSIYDAQNVLRQGFQGITNGIQSVVANNEPIQTLQLSIQSLRDGFTAQMIKVNETIQSYLNTESIGKPAAEKTKASFHEIEQGLFKLKNDFNREVSTLTSGVDVAAALKADNETPAESSGATSAPTSPAPAPSLVSSFVNTISDWQTSMNNILQSWSDRIMGAANATNISAVPTGVQSDSQATPAPAAAFTPTNIINQGVQNFQNLFQPQPGQFGSGTGYLAGVWNQFVSSLTITTPKPAVSQASQGTQPAPSGQSTPAEQAVKPENKPEAQANPAKPAEGAEAHAQTAAVTPVGPIRQILQNNPITLGIAGAVQRLQNINNPEKPRDEKTQEQVIKLNEDKADSERKKGGGPNSGDNNDSSNSGDRVEQTEEVKEEIEQIPEVEKVSEVKQGEEKTEEVVVKTE